MPSLDEVDLTTLSFESYWDLHISSNAGFLK